MADPALHVARLSKEFPTANEPVEVLREIDLALEEGESLAITGPSGSGKSTLLHILGTLEPPTSGEVRIAGQDPFAKGEVELARFRNRHIGFVFQDHHLLPQYSVLENVLLPAFAFPDTAGDDAEIRARELLDGVGLGHRLDHRPAELSGGERQRAAVARALVMSPRLLLCDEPTGSLDQRTATTVAELLMELHRAEKTVLVLVTHSLELAGYAERRVELLEGRCSET